MRNKKIIVGAALAVAAIAGISGYFLWSSQTQSPKAASNKAKTESLDNDKTSDIVDATGAAAESGEESLAVYENSRYGFRVNYPEDWQVKQSNNGDGAVFAIPANTGVDIRAYGYMTEGATLSKMMTDLEEEFRSGHNDLAVTGKQNILLDNHPAIEAEWTYTATADDRPLSGLLGQRIILTRKDQAGLVLRMIGEPSALDGLTAEFTLLKDKFALQ